MKEKLQQKPPLQTGSEVIQESTRMTGTPAPPLQNLATIEQCLRS